MLEGLYSVKFSSNVGNWGAGVALFTNGKVYGGDASYYHRGTASVEGAERQRADSRWTPPGRKNVYLRLTQRI